MNAQPKMRLLVADYLRARRALGYELRTEGEELIRFARFADGHGHEGPLTTDLALQWASSSKAVSPLFRARRLEIVRNFARYRFIYDPATEIPPAGLLGPAHRRVTPHIYSEQEIADLMDATAQLPPVCGLRPATVRCLFGLLAATGLRPSEALRLARADVDLENGLLAIRKTKFHKSRQLPLHVTTTEALRDYCIFRNQRTRVVQSEAFFLLDGGVPLTYKKTAYAFRQVRRLLGWDTSRSGRRPRLYDFRHYFVCRRLLSWYADGVLIDQVIPFLSTYLGHNKVSDTYWYITGIPELMAMATERFESYGQSLQEERL